MTASSTPYSRAAAARLRTPAELRAGFQELALQAAALATRLRGGPVPHLAHALAALEYQAATLELAVAAQRPDAREPLAVRSADEPSDPCARGLMALAERARVLPGMARLRGRFESLAQACEHASRLADAQP